MGIGGLTIVPPGIRGIQVYYDKINIDGGQTGLEQSIFLVPLHRDWPGTNGLASQGHVFVLVQGDIPWGLVKNLWNNWKRNAFILSKNKLYMKRQQEHYGLGFFLFPNEQFMSL